MHPKVSVNTYLVRELPIESIVQGLAFHGIDCATLMVGQFEDADQTIDALHRASISVRSLVVPNLCDLRSAPSRADALRALLDGIELAVRIRAPMVYTTSGAARHLEWEAALDGALRVLEPAAEAARNAGIQLLVENSSPIRANYGFCHTLADTAELAKSAGCGIVADLGTCWTDRGLRSVLVRELGSIQMIQLSDFQLGSTDASRKDSLGDGDVPLVDLLDLLATERFSGVFDIELNGPRVADEGAFAAMDRSVRWLESNLSTRGL
jgi:sugar phosphate isomerase/epimerase